MAPALWITALLAAAFMLTASSGDSNNPTYMVTVSSRLRGGKEEILCAQIQNPTGGVVLNISLNVDSTDHVILQESINKDFYSCINFQVPVVQTETVATIQISLQGVGASMTNRTKVFIEPSDLIHIIQTDKPIYKPGQTVKFRIASMDANFLPVQQLFTEVTLQDPNSNRIAQWSNVGNDTEDMVILDFSHPTITEAPQGIYVINAVTDEGKVISHNFEIKEYVLPKYEVNVYLPSEITILDTNFTMKICGKYTYGKPVLGSINAEICRQAFGFLEIPGNNLCESYTQTTDKSGCVTETVNLGTFSLNSYGYSDSLEINAELEEFGTGVTLKGTGTVSITSEMMTISFEDVPSSYKPGIPYEGKIKVVGPDNKPISNQVVYLFVENAKKLTVTTDLKGIVLFSLDTTFWTASVSLRASTTERTETEPFVPNLRRPVYGTAYQYVSPFYSKSNSFLELKRVDGGLPCDKNATLKVQYIIQKNELTDKRTTLDFFYLVLAKGVIVRHDSVPVAVTAGDVNKGQFSITLSQVINLAPFAQMVVYTVMPSGEIVADSQDFPVQLCLNNQVSLKFSAPQELPGEQTTLTLKAHRKSLCSVRAIDQSVLLLKPEEEITVDYVYSQLPVQKLSGFPYEVEDSEAFPCFPRPWPFPRFEVPAAAGPEPTPMPTSGPTPMTMPEQTPVTTSGPTPMTMPEQTPVTTSGPTPMLTPEQTPVTTSGPTPMLTPEPTPGAPSRRKRSPFFPSSYQEDVYRIFKNIGVKIVTNSNVRKPYECSWLRFEKNFAQPMNGFAMPQNAPAPAAPAPPGSTQNKETVRTYFPETWIWDLIPVGENGSVDLQKTVPDTITKWAAGAFCVSSVGFGVAPNADLTAFQPFFVSLTLPYSVIRGEEFTLKATVFSYLSQCITVNATLAESDQYTFKACDGCVYSACVCGEETSTFSWIVTPTALGDVSLNVSAEALESSELCGNKVAIVPDVGRKDTVISTLLVEAEGTPQMDSYNALLCPAKGSVEKNISLILPEMFVNGSARATVSVLGDLMGRAMQNLDKLLAMPYGCGEQNMLLFAPNIFILNYLNSSGQLTLAILAKAKGFLESGYQRELNYKHTDGSYSAFGNGDEYGNTWLTAFVMKSFSGASAYIYVDPQQVKDARSWLSRLQRTDGCIASVGKLFHSSMKGGVSDDVSLTAYVAAAMLELDGSPSDPVVQNCLKCLKAVVDQGLDNLYTTALLSYTYSLAGDQEMRKKLITQLNQKAITKEGTIHWERTETSENGLDSLNVELTSYVLLALLTSPPMEGFGLDYTSGIVHWLVQQQNPYGGFSSTQDTVVALQALAKYAAATYSPQGTTTVTVTSLGGLNKVFTVNQDNRLLYQEEKLSEVPGEYNITAEGQSCVLTQISMYYNIPPPNDFSAFLVTTSIMAKCNSAQPQLILLVFVRYQGRREETNMVIVNIKLLSGYVPDQASIKQLQSYASVKRVDVEKGFINIYLDEMKKDIKQVFSVTLDEDQQVRNLKPAVVKVYDYYQTGDQGVTEYTSPCAESDNINEV